ncbi:MAG TPA: sugar ABC transporter substrate-binding protein [Burkholderiaceae bacterium]
MTVPGSRCSRRRWLARAAAAATAPLALGACTRRDAASAPLRFWAMGREGEVAPALLDGFARAHPGHPGVRVEQLPWSAAHEKLLTAFAGDSTPDVAQLGNTWIAELAALGALEPLAPWLDAAGLGGADVFEGIWNTNRIDGTLYGLPWYVDTRLLFYRRDLFARAGVAAMPEDWAGFVRALDALQGSGVPHPLLLPLTEFEPLLAFALQQGDPLLRDGGRWGNFRGAGFRRALAFYLDRFARGHAPYLTGNRIANLWQEFGRGTFAAFISGPWNIGELERRLPASQQADWATAPLPGPHGPGASTAGGSSLVIFRRSRRKAEAMRLLEYLSRPEVQLRFHALTGNLPPRRATWRLARAGGVPLADDPRAAAFARQLERVVAAPAVPEWERIAQEMQLQAAQAQHDGTPVDAACAALDARVDGFLAKRRWMLERHRAA